MSHEIKLFYPSVLRQFQLIAFEKVTQFYINMKYI